MITLKQIKNDIEFNRELSGLIDVLKGIASSHFRHLQAKREYFTRFNKSLETVFQMLDLIKSDHPFIQGFPLTPPLGADAAQANEPDNESRARVKKGIVMITSDEGFLGELNSLVINAGLALRQRGDELIVLGERGAHFLEEIKEQFLFFPGIAEEIEHAQTQGLRDYLIQQYLKKRFGSIVIVYPKFISFAHQEANIEQLLPYVLAKAKDSFPPPPYLSYADILVEPSQGRVIDYLIRVWMGQKLYDIFWDSKLSELASRVLHLERGTDVISELSRRLQLLYFRIIHQISDKNIREIISSRLIK